MFFATCFLVNVEDTLNMLWHEFPNTPKYSLTVNSVSQQYYFLFFNG
jgi:hypothetical protein